MDPEVLLPLPPLLVVVAVALNEGRWFVEGEKGTETGFIKELLLIKLPPAADDDGATTELLWKDKGLGLFN